MQDLGWIQQGWEPWDSEMAFVGEIRLGITGELKDMWGKD